MRKFSLLSAAILSAALPVAASALTAPATPPAAAAPAEDGQATMDRAGMIFGLFSQAVRTDEIAGAEKNALLGCMYENSLKVISTETGRVLAANPELDATKPNNVYAVAATVCGARQNGQAAPADGAAAAPATPAPESR